MPTGFQYDVFLSHSSKDKGVVRDIATRLKKDGLKVWFDEWEIKPGDSIPARIEDGLENSRILVLCMSANAFGSDWAQLESGTFRFRDPLNKERRFIPVRLDDTPITGSLAQFLYIEWDEANGKPQYSKLLESCGHATGTSQSKRTQDVDAQFRSRIMATRRNGWKRMRKDFEAQAKKYHDAKLSVFYIAKGGPLTQTEFPKPNYVISLWQYYGTTDSESAIERLSASQRTKFGVSGAELSCFGLIIGKKTELFCNMARRAGSLLPSEVNKPITDRLFEIFRQEKQPGKPIIVTNENALAKWLNLMLIVTQAAHPERFKSLLLEADPFVTSLTVFDFFQAHG
jgi:hypothetical protein